MPSNKTRRKIDLPFWIAVAIIIVSTVVFGALFG